MEILERSTTRDIMNSDTPFDPMPTTPSKAFWPRFWRRLCAFIGIAAISLTLASVSAIKDRLASEWQSSLSRFKWVVLVSGDSVEVDEVGRFLKQLDAVGPVTLLPSAAITEQIKSEPLLSEQLSVLDTASLPSVWSVSWTPAFDSSKVAQDIEELKRYPGVIDVAFDGRELDKATAYRVLWLKVRVLMSALAVLGGVLFSVLLGRFLFFTELRGFKAAPLTWFVAGTFLAWGAGLGIAYALVGPFSAQLAWGAVVAAVARLAWGRVRASE